MTVKKTDKVEFAGLEEPFAAEPEARPAPRASLDLALMPTALHFRRSHFAIPAAQPAVSLAGAVSEPLSLTVDELRERWSARTVNVVLECAGHRRSELRPETAGIAWGIGAVSEAEWTGTPLRDVLAAAAFSPRALSVAFHGSDRGSHRAVEGTVSFGRAISLAKAIDADTLLAWEMNGQPIPAVHGGPLRAIVPGHYAVDSVKWLTQVDVLEHAFDGVFQAQDYRLYESGGAPGGVELHELPVHALLVHPADGEHIVRGRPILSGIAWGGRGGVARVEVSIDGGRWRAAELEPATRWGRVRWRLSWYARPGLCRIAVRATHRAGGQQPDAPRWNELGYANNSVHRATLGVR